ncbi:MAG: hypothetical protein DRN20_04560 [Thermoplasmata archaeon]|nr:MAG: hypothetical protein DRN20_04560 [Thermoplasmata archaeon]
MTTELSKKIHMLLVSEMGPIGKFIVKKQCQDLGIDPDSIEEEDLPRLSDAIENAIVNFTGKEKANMIKWTIRKMAKK